MNKRKRSRLTKKDRKKIFSKTQGHCHVCGCKLEGKWVANLVVPHALGGERKVENCVPSCSKCNRLRWFYKPNTLKKIFRLGVYGNKEIEKETSLGSQIEKLYLKRRKRNSKRRKYKQAKLETETKKKKEKEIKQKRRSRLTKEDRKKIFSKTQGHCHMCGCKLEGSWDADHVVPHAAGGKCKLNNFLPCCSECNNLRWFYRPKKFKKIFRLGVYSHKEIEKETSLGTQIEKLYKKRLERNRKRRKKK